MKALFYENNSIDLKTDVSNPVPNESEVLVYVQLAGICRTDLEITKGYMNYTGILGHEFTGITASSTPTLESGSRVVGEINAGCGQCSYCNRGLQRHCPNRTVLGIYNRDGCMAEQLILPPQNLYKIPDTVSDQQAVFTEPLAAALEIFEQVHIQPNHKVCIIGDGKLGLLIAMLFAWKHDGPLRLIGRHADKMALVSGKIERIHQQDFIPHKEWDIVVEATGQTSGLALAMNLIKPRGILVLKSTFAEPQPIDLTPIVIDEITMIGSRCGRFEPALTLLEKQVIPVEALIDSIYPLDDVAQAWQRASQKGSTKVLLQIGSSQ